MSVETRESSRPRKALLASGVVLSLGAAATLAAWTDNVYASGIFSSSSFGIELNVDGGWNDVREMTFTADQMYPGSVVYAPVLVRTTDGSELGADLTLTGDGATGALMAALEYRVVVTTVPGPWAATGEGSPPDCNDNRFIGGPNFALGSPVATAPMSDPVTADSAQQISATGADYAAYCFEVTLSKNAPSAVQGDTADHTWTWNAESVSEEA